MKTKPKSIDMTGWTNSDGFEMLHRLQSHLGWAGTMFTRNDVEAELERKLSKKEWNAVQNSRVWDRYLQEALTERGFDVIHGLITQLKLPRKQDR